MFVITARKQSLRRLCFYRCLSVHRGGVRGCSRGGMCGCSGGACVVAPGSKGWGVMHGCSGGACMVAPGGCMVALGGCAWLLLGGMRGEGGHAWRRRGMCGEGGVRGEGGMHGEGGACMVKGGCAWYAPPPRYGQPLHRWYASYWNAFL